MFYINYSYCCVIFFTLHSLHWKRTLVLHQSNRIGYLRQAIYCWRRLRRKCGVRWCEGKYICVAKLQSNNSDSIRRWLSWKMGKYISSVGIDEDQRMNQYFLLHFLPKGCSRWVFDVLLDLIVVHVYDKGRWRRLDHISQTKSRFGDTVHSCAATLYYYWLTRNCFMCISYPTYKTMKESSLLLDLRLEKGSSERDSYPWPKFSLKRK